jgi:hypothetical protein
MRDLRTVNMSVGQKAESEKVFKRIGDIDYRNLGTFSKILFNTGKVAVLSGLRVEESSGMTVNVPAGVLIQRNSSGENFPVVMTDDILVTMDAASGISRTDIIECQVKSVAVKDDYAQSVLDPETGIISMEPVKRDIKYYLDARKKTGSTTPTAATAASLIGTAEIVSSVDLSSRYIINLIDGEDGNAIEIDLRGATPEATTKAEIAAAINAAIGRTGASVSGNYMAMSGDGTGVQSFFEFKPPVTDTDLDCLDLVFGLAIGGLYSYQYHGSNDWFKICEIDIDVASIVVTNAMIRDIDEKSTWASDAADTYTGLSVSVYNADLLDGYHANTGTIAETVPVRDSGGKLPGDITGDAATVGGVGKDSILYLSQNPNELKAVVSISSGSYDNIQATGLYRIEGGGAVSNAPDVNAYFLEHIQHGETAALQTARRVGASNVYIRRKISETWQSWIPIMDSSGNPVYQTLASAPRGFKNAINAVSWTLNFTNGQKFFVHQSLIVRVTGTGTLYGYYTDSAVLLCGAAGTTYMYTLVPGRYSVTGAITFNVSNSPSSTQADIITIE